MRPQGLLVWLAGAAVAAAAGAAAGWPQTPARSEKTTLTQAEAERIRRSLDRLQANQEQMLSTLDAIAAELAIAKVRATR